MISYEKKGQVGIVTLDRPEKMNAMGQDFWFGMPPVFDRINEDMNVRAVVLAARGKAFSVGLDFFDMIPRLGLGSAGPDGERQRKLHQLIRDMQWAVTCVERCRVPVIAAIHGYCLGGAVDLITAATLDLHQQMQSSVCVNLRWVSSRTLGRFKDYRGSWGLGLLVN